LIEDEDLGFGDWPPNPHPKWDPIFIGADSRYTTDQYVVIVVALLKILAVNDECLRCGFASISAR